MTTPFNQQLPPPGLQRRVCADRSAAAKPAVPRHTRQPTVVTLPSEIDVANASEVRDALTLAIASGTTVLVADATGTTFCDCRGVGMLIRAHHQAAAAGTALRVAGATSRQLRRILELTGADQVLDTYPTLTAALSTQSPLTPVEEWHVD
jgi:anti-anti-sigma factor